MVWPWRAKSSLPHVVVLSHTEGHDPACSCTRLATDRAWFSHLFGVPCKCRLVYRWRSFLATVVTCADSWGLKAHARGLASCAMPPCFCLALNCVPHSGFWSFTTDVSVQLFYIGSMPPLTPRGAFIGDCRLAEYFFGALERFRWSCFRSIFVRA